MPTLKEVADLLCAYKKAKSEVSKLKKEVSNMAIKFGASPHQVKDARVFLDGYLIGQGMHEAWREVEEIEEDADGEVKRLSVPLCFHPDFEFPEQI